MIQPQGVALTHYFTFSESKLGKTGLTVTVDVWRVVAGVATQIVTDGSAVELGGGAYTYTLAAGSNTVAGAEYLAKAKTATATVDQQHVWALWVVPGWLSTLNGILAAVSLGAVTYVSPFNPNTGKLTLVRGDDYKAGVPGTLPPFTSSSWPNLTGATVRMTVRLLPSPTAGEEDDSLLTLTDTVASRIAGAGLQSVTFEPLARPGSPVLNNQVGGTHYLVPGRNRGKWDIQATLADGTIRTLAVGLMDVTEDQTRDVAP